jgi:hypothetical protein
VLFYNIYIEDMDIIQQKKKCSVCRKLQPLTAYGTKKKGGEFISCITCRRKKYTPIALRRIHEGEKPKYKPSLWQVVYKLLENFIRYLISRIID